MTCGNTKISAHSWHYLWFTQWSCACACLHTDIKLP
uniref:Uncharacterized protein n=1 Tax=Anguilla anguilla TaxID=7936 RepID=A0A0E9XGG4_ANGAN